MLLKRLATVKLEIVEPSDYLRFFFSWNNLYKIYNICHAAENSQVLCFSFQESEKKMYNFWPVTSKYLCGR